MTSKDSFPQGSILEINGKCIVLKGDDIDTDRIIPARFLKCVNFNELGEHLFQDDRQELKGEHPFDLKENRESSILIVNDNFGCGSSREHAPQALMRWGIRAIVGQSFAEIFYGNCLALGIPCATASIDIINDLQNHIQSNQSSSWTLKIQKETLSSAGTLYQINIEPGSLEMLITGRWDATSQLISKSEKIRQKLESLPYLTEFHKEIK